MMWDDHIPLVFKRKWWCLHGGIIDMIRSKKYWIILCLIGLLCLGGEGVAAPSQSQSDPSLSKPVSVLLYHPWEEGFEVTFRDHLDWLKQNGYQTIPMETLIDYLEGKEVSLPPNPILLTFDDGTIENYDIVYPILKEFGYMGTAFVITGPRFIRYSKKFWWKEVDRSGILKIENHSRTHSFIWINPQIIDFYSGEDPGDYFLIKGMDRRLGAPIYKFNYELINERYVPDRRIGNLCVNYVAQNGGKKFFKREGWKDGLFQVVKDFRNTRRQMDSYEKEPQRELRLKNEIYQSKRAIEQSVGHGKEVTFFAYPWGAYDEELILKLKKYGYRGAFTTDRGRNFPGDDLFKIKRFIITSEMTVEDLSNVLKSEWRRYLANPPCANP